MEEKRSYVEKLRFLMLPGPVKLNKPDIPIYMCFNFIGPESSAPCNKDDGPVESSLLYVFIGRLLAAGGMKEVFSLMYIHTLIPNYHL